MWQPQEAERHLAAKLEGWPHCVFVDNDMISMIIMISMISMISMILMTIMIISIMIMMRPHGVLSLD